MRLFTALIALLIVAADASAWSNKEHIQLTRIAVMRLLNDAGTPAEMKAWLKRACPGVMTMEEEREFFLKQRVGLIPPGVTGMAYWAIMPDMIAMTSGSGEREKKVAPFGVGERLLHYVDLEYFHPEAKNRKYRHDLGAKPKLEDVPLEDMNDERWKTAGMLPFRVEQCYGELVRCIKAGKLVDQPGQFPRDDHAVKWAGYLAHYLEDNTQPQHATEDYKSKTYFADKRPPNVHWDVEGRLMDDDDADHMELRKEFWELFAGKLESVKDPIQTRELKKATIEVLMVGYDLLPLVGTAAMAAYGQGGTPEKPEGPIGKFDPDTFFKSKGKYLGREMTLMEAKAHQMAWAVKRLERVLRQAWDEGTK